MILVKAGRGKRWSVLAPIIGNSIRQFPHPTDRFRLGGVFALVVQDHPDRPLTHLGGLLDAS